MKKVISYLLICITLLTTTLVVPSSDIQRITPEKYAQSFIDTIEPNSGIRTFETVEIYNEEDLLSGFCISLKRGLIPYGYVVITLDQNEPIVSEFVIQENVGDIYNEIAKNSKTKHKAVEGKKKIFSFYPNEYVVPLESQAGIKYYDLYGEELNSSEFKSQKETIRQHKHMLAKGKGQQNRRNKNQTIYTNSYYDHSSVFFSDVYSGKLTNSYNLPYLSKFKIYGQDNITKPTKKYACATVAMLNAVSYYYSKLYNATYGNIDVAVQAFNRLWNLSGVKVYETRDGIQYGSTQISKVGTALKKYYSTYTSNKCTVNNFMFCSYSSFVNELNNKKPCILHIYYKRNNYEVSGHSVFVVGYARTTTDDYLRVADGWSSVKLRYINYTGYSYTDIEGCSITVK